MVEAAVVLIVAGLALIAFGWWRFRRRVGASEAASGSWRQVDGTLHEAEIREEIEYDSDNDPVVHHAPHVRFAYEAGGETRAGTRAFFSRTRFDNEAQARGWLAGKAPGGKVTVWHDPADPSQSVLELDRPAKGELIGYIIGGVVLIGIGLSFFAG